MKKLLLTMVLLVAGLAPLFAQSPHRSTLRLRLSDGAPLSVTIDGRRWDRQSTSITVRDLPAGMHRIQVYRIEAASPGYSRRSRAILIYTGTIRMRPETFHAGVIDVTSGTLGLRTRRYDAQSDGYGYDDGRPDGGYGAGNENNHNRDEDYDRGDDGRAGVNNNGRAFSSRDMDDLRARVAQRITDTDKESLLKTALEGRSYTTAQVADMLKMLSFDSTRLDFAKWAFGQVSDRSNYWKLESAFSFSSSKEEFSNYIRSAR